MAVVFREGGGRGPWGPREKVERPADKAVRRANGRRIVRLFRPYWGKLGVVSLLIVVSSGLGVVSPFLLRDVLDKAIVVSRGAPTVVHLGRLTFDAVGMVVIA